jgi:hypothetical protein
MGSRPVRWPKIILLCCGRRRGRFFCRRLLQALDDDRDQRNDQQGQDPVQRMVNRPGHLRLQSSRFKLQRIDRGSMDFGCKFEFTPARRPRGDRKQNRGNHEVDPAENGRSPNGAPDLDQREIGR